jgi:hypothetical protein
LLSPEQSLLLTQAILGGPPAQFYGEDISAEDLATLSAGEIGERLLALEASGLPLPPDAAAFLSEIKRAQAPEQIRSPGEEKSLANLTTPEIAEILRNGFPEIGLYRKQWNEMVSRDWSKAVAVLRQLSDLNIWPTDVWAAALYHASAFISSGLKGDDVLPVLDAIVAAPDDFVAQNVHALAVFLHFLPGLKSPSGDDLYWRLWDRAFNAAQSEAAIESPAVKSIDGAVNTAVGRLTEALFEWVNRRPETDMGELFWERLRIACSEQSNWGKAARAVTAMRLAWLFARRPEWTSETLLPFFDWNHPEDAAIVWQGFSFGATFTPALWFALKKDFLAAFENLEKLDSEAVRILYQALGSIAIHEPEWLTNDEAQRIVTGAPHIGREQIAWVFWRNLDGAADKADTLWRDRIGPWLAACWQPDEALKDKETAHSLIMMALSAGDALPEAVDLVTPRMPTLDRAESAIFAIAGSKAPEQFPQATLKLLDRVVNRNQRFYKGDLEKLLTRVAQAWSGARQDSRFLDLFDFAAG